MSRLKPRLGGQAQPTRKSKEGAQRHQSASKMLAVRKPKAAEQKSTHEPFTTRRVRHPREFKLWLGYTLVPRPRVSHPSSFTAEKSSNGDTCKPKLRSQKVGAVTFQAGYRVGKLLFSNLTVRSPSESAVTLICRDQFLGFVRCAFVRRVRRPCRLAFVRAAKPSDRIGYCRVGVLACTVNQKASQVCSLGWIAGSRTRRAFRSVLHGGR
jgi:hypothetical protein